MLRENFEFYWPKNARDGVSTVSRMWEVTENRYGELVVVPKVEVANDDGTQRTTWNLTELEESFARGWAVPFAAGVPRRARKKLNTLAIQLFSTTLDPTDFASFLIDGFKVNMATTTWSERFVGMVDDDGKIIRKRSIVDQVLLFLAARGIHTE